MSQSLAKILIQIVFSTKNRLPVFAEPLRRELYSYLAGILKQCHTPAIRIGGTTDHVHILCNLSRTLTIAMLVEEVKTGSSKWLKTRDPEFRSFHWQNGYGAFSISQSGLEALVAYIDNQEEHHRRRSFQDEYRALLERYQLAYDERYVWD
jgi:REP element-mobilizing transposase RayT